MCHRRIVLNHRVRSQPPCVQPAEFPVRMPAHSGIHLTYNCAWLAHHTTSCSYVARAPEDTRKIKVLCRVHYRPLLGMCAERPSICPVPVHVCPIYCTSALFGGTSFETAVPIPFVVAVTSFRFVGWRADFSCIRCFVVGALVFHARWGRPRWPVLHGRSPQCEIRCTTDGLLLWSFPAFYRATLC